MSAALWLVALIVAYVVACAYTWWWLRGGGR